MNYYEFQWLVSYWIILIRPKFYKGLTTKLITSFSHESPRVTYLNPKCTRHFHVPHRLCQCGTEMVLRDRNVMDGLIWECLLRTCRKRRSIRAGSFCEDSKISLGQWLNIIYLWSIDVSDKQLSLMTGFSLHTIATTLGKIRQMCSLKILHGNIKLEWRSTSQCLDISASTTGGKRQWPRSHISCPRSHERDVSNPTGTRVHPTRNSDRIWQIFTLF